MKVSALLLDLSEGKGVQELQCFIHILSPNFNKVLFLNKGKLPMMADFFILPIKQ